MVAPRNGQDPIRVLCVDDLPDITAIMHLLIDAEPDMQCVGEARNADHLLEDVRRSGATVVLLDATMPGRNPLEAMAELSRQSPQIRTIIYSAHDDRQFLHRAMEAGAWGCASKNDSPKRLIEAVRVGVEPRPLHNNEEQVERTVKAVGEMARG